jgi:signal transduction histidine kinase
MHSTVAVLLVEDNPGDARLFREYLREAGLLSPAFVHVSRLEEARRAMEDASPDVVLLDLSLPDAHGLSTVIGMLEVAGEVPIIVLTGLADTNMAIQAVQRGAQDYLVKGEVDAAGLARSIRYSIERKQLDRERNRLLELEHEARRRAEAAVRARDEVLRIVSHDLGNPISGVLINTSVLLRRVRDDEQLTEIRLRIEEIRTLALQMQRLRRDLLDVAVIEAGQLTITPQLVETGDIVRTALERMRPLAVEQEVVLEAEVAPSAERVVADRERILQVLDNLLGNAIKFSPSGGRGAVAVEELEGTTRFTVDDEGPGIPEENRERVFDRFWKVEERNRTGAGLGLAISKGIVEAHGGRIWVEGAPGSGSRFRFELPGRA